MIFIGFTQLLTVHFALLSSLHTSLRSFRSAQFTALRFKFKAVELRSISRTSLISLIFMNSSMSWFLVVSSLRSDLDFDLS